MNMKKHKNKGRGGNSFSNWIPVNHIEFGKSKLLTLLTCILTLNQLAHSTCSSRRVERDSVSRRTSSIGLSTTTRNDIFLPPCKVHLPQDPPRPFPPGYFPDNSTNPQKGGGSLSNGSEGLGNSPQNRGPWEMKTRKKEKGAFILSSKIVGGMIVNERLSKYIALLQVGSESLRYPVCTATIVGPSLLITAAHCVKFNLAFPFKFLLRFGADDLRDISSPYRKVKEIVSHPLFNLSNADTAIYDIAFIRIHGEVPSFSRYFKINANPSIPKPRSILRASGYGLHAPDNALDPPDGNLHQVDVPNAPFRVCKIGFKDGFSINLDSKYQICAGYLKGGCGTCFGDSGGALFQYDMENRPVLIGIPSLTFSCDTKNVPSVFARLSPFVHNFLPTKELKLEYKTQSVILSKEDAQEPDHEDIL